ncbi:MAG: glycosyltransferase [Bacteroidales bacterium]|nr:glycosyltransferase [Bacteroidales bacterium]
MNILYIGAFSIKSIIDKYPNLGLDRYKTSEFLIKGFKKIKEVNLDVITAPDVPSYPKLPKKFKKEIDTDNKTISVGFTNIKGIKQFSIIHNLYKEACKIVKRNCEKTYVIIPYMVFHHVRVAKLLKNKFKDKVVICQIIPDIFHTKKKASAFYWMNKYSENNAKKSDAFVLFTKAMSEYLNIPDEKFMIMESVIDGNSYNLSSNNINNDNDKLHVLYTGALRKEHGIMKFVDMMNHIKRDDFELWITGIGPLSDKLKDAADKDSRIKFFGTVAKDKVFELQSKADILINPRSDDDSPELTRYMFPSKLMEYMLTGNPAVICRMSGIPEDYYQYTFVADNGTSESLAQQLNKVLDMTDEERKTIGSSARQYILDNKTISVQSKRIVDFIKQF